VLITGGFLASLAFIFVTSRYNLCVHHFDSSVAKLSL
jgi:hypothetical protein